MIISMDSFLRYFRGVQQRTTRDVALLPAKAAAWRPTSPGDEVAWDVDRIVEHVAVSRLMFVNVYCGDGWLIPDEPVTGGPEGWLPALEASAAALDARLRATPDEWLSRRVGLPYGAGDIAGWRVLMLMTEHEIHHRSQLATYAGLNGWPVADLFGRSYEDLEVLQPDGRRTATD